MKRFLILFLGLTLLMLAPQTAQVWAQDDSASESGENQKEGSESTAAVVPNETPDPVNGPDNGDFAGSSSSGGDTSGSGDSSDSSGSSDAGDKKDSAKKTAANEINSDKIAAIVKKCSTTVEGIYKLDSGKERMSEVAQRVLSLYERGLMGSEGTTYDEALGKVLKANNSAFLSGGSEFPLAKFSWPRLVGYFKAEGRKSDSDIDEGVAALDAACNMIHQEGDVISQISLIDGSFLRTVGGNIVYNDRKYSNSLVTTPDSAEITQLVGGSVAPVDPLNGPDNGDLKGSSLAPSTTEGKDDASLLDKVKNAGKDARETFDQVKKGVETAKTLKDDAGKYIKAGKEIIDLAKGGTKNSKEILKIAKETSKNSGDDVKKIQGTVKTGQDIYNNLTSIAKTSDTKTLTKPNSGTTAATNTPATTAAVGNSESKSNSVGQIVSKALGAIFKGNLFPKKADATDQKTAATENSNKASAGNSTESASEGTKTKVVEILVGFIGKLFGF